MRTFAISVFLSPFAAFATLAARAAMRGNDAVNLGDGYVLAILAAVALGFVLSVRAERGDVEELLDEIEILESEKGGTK